MEHPFIAATPDALVSCTCCGKGVAEFKCPYSVGPYDTQSCLSEQQGQLHLKRHHKYFYQIQTQIAVCRVTYCDFVMWLPKHRHPKHLDTEWLHIERIHYDENFWHAVVGSARQFFVCTVLPELFSKHFTRKEGARKEAVGQGDKYCYCQGPEIGKMIACDDRECKYKWFHFQCLGL